LAEVASGKLAASFAGLVNMVLSHASEEGADDAGGPVAKAGVLDSLKGMLAKPKAKAA
jgi:pilus assembly protein CpaE